MYRLHLRKREHCPLAYSFVTVQKLSQHQLLPFLLKIDIIKTYIFLGDSSDKLMLTAIHANTSLLGRPLLLLVIVILFFQ